MERFTIIDDEAVVLRSKGVYRQAKLYRRGKELFAGWGGGFIGLHASGTTSKPDISWLEVSVQHTNKLTGRLSILS